MGTRKLLGILLVYCVAGCHSYTTFYKRELSPTSTSTPPVYRLDLSHQEADVIIPILSSTTRIKSLNLSGSNPSDLEKIVESIPNPEQLRVLLLDSMGIQYLPNTISRLSKLEHLSLNGNPQLDMNQIFEVLKTQPIAFINLQNNQLQKLPASIKNIQTLQELNLSGNHMVSEETYKHLGALKQLKSLWLTNNKLEALPPTIGVLQQLRNLYLEHNNLSDIPDEIHTMKRTWVVHAGHNNFKKLPEQFAKMPGLLLLHINNCSIEKIPEIYASKTSNVLGLILDNNPLSQATKNKWRKIFRRFFVLSME